MRPLTRLAVLGPGLLLVAVGMRRALDARADDDNVTVIDWSTGRYDVTRTAR